MQDFSETHRNKIQRHTITNQFGLSGQTNYKG